MIIGIIGTGLIGGSLGLALSGCGHTVLGADRSGAALEKAKLIGAVGGEITEVNAGTLDVLFCAVNPAAYGAVTAPLLPLLKSDALVTDVGGTKRGVCNCMKRQSKDFPHLQFIAAHPMAGKETRGISHASANLFKNASVLLMPVAAELSTLSAFKSLMTDAGFRFVRFTTPETHDRMIAYTSQLPHVLSSCYVQSPLAAEHDGFSAGSFSDLTRVARAAADLWTELFIENRDFLLPAIERFRDNLGAFASAIEKGDAATLHALIERGNRYKTDIDRATRIWKKENEEGNNT